MRSRGTALVLVASWLISACVTTAPPEDLSREESLARWQEFRESLSRIDHWKLRGKMGVRTGSKGGSATLNWEYSADAQEIELYGPLGGGRVIITTDAQSAFLRDTKGREITGKTASEVLYRRLGWQVPFDHLVDWARGLPGEGATDVVIDGNGRLKRLVQDYWEVEFEEYGDPGESVPGLALPAKLRVTALPGTMAVYSDEGEYLGDELSVKVILKRWREVESGRS